MLGGGGAEGGQSPDRAGNLGTPFVNLIEKQPEFIAIQTRSLDIFMKFIVSSGFADHSRRMIVEREKGDSAGEKPGIDFILCVEIEGFPTQMQPRIAGEAWAHEFQRI